MGRILVLVFIVIIGWIFTAAKKTTGKIINNQKLKDTSVKGESKKIMDKAAKGVNWMEDQWKDSKKNADKSKKTDDWF
jgi:Tfp pilus assembly protein PilO|tara:strand:- start:312 stop:545 length:234 start_codon:yes stop_codon:yes gene_type:complete